MENNSTWDSEKCVICQSDSDGRIQNVGSTGLATLIHFSNLRSEEALECYLTSQQEKESFKVVVHDNCRKNFTNARRLKTAKRSSTETSSTSLRSKASHFDWKSCCFLCTELAVMNEKHPDRQKIHRASTLPFKASLEEVCRSRDDEWGEQVLARISDCIDLVASEAVYHHNCYTRFVLTKVPTTSSSTVSEDRRRSGRRENNEKSSNFQRLCDWLDQEVEMYTISDLHAKLRTIAQSEEGVYTVKRLKQKLEDHYKDAVFFTDEPGRSNVVCFKDMASTIISDKWYADRKDNIAEESMRVITAAAELIKNEIRCTQFSVDTYPTESDIENIQGYLPPYLQYLMDLLIPSEVKRNSIGQCILKAIKPNSVIPPILFGVGVEMDHMFGSKWLLSELSKLGFCISYDEVLRYKQSVIASTDCDPVMPCEFAQWVGDNVDHNIATIDGKGTFHGMGIISASISVANIPMPNRQIKRLAICSTGCFDGT